MYSILYIFLYYIFSIVILSIIDMSVYLRLPFFPKLCYDLLVTAHLALIIKVII